MTSTKSKYVKFTSLNGSASQIVRFSGEVIIDSVDVTIGLTESATVYLSLNEDKNVTAFSVDSAIAIVAYRYATDIGRNYQSEHLYLNYRLDQDWLVVACTTNLADDVYVVIRYHDSKGGPRANRNPEYRRRVR